MYSISPTSLNPGTSPWWLPWTGLQRKHRVKLEIHERRKCSSRRWRENPWQTGIPLPYQFDSLTHLHVTADKQQCDICWLKFAIPIWPMKSKLCSFDQFQVHVFEDGAIAMFIEMWQLCNYSSVCIVPDILARSVRLHSTWHGGLYWEIFLKWPRINEVCEALRSHLVTSFPIKIAHVYSITFWD